MGSSGAVATAAAQATTSVACGVASVPVLGVGATSTVTVTIKPAMPSTAYQPAAWITSNGIGGLDLLGSLEVQSVAVLSASQITVTVKNTGLLSLSGAYAVALGVAN